jgi:hypothetical protein
VTGRGEEARLGNVGFVGIGLGAGEFAVEPGEFGRAFEFLGGDHAWCDVGDGGHETAVRHPVGANLDDQPALGKAFEHRFAACRVALDAFQN